MLASDAPKLATSIRYVPVRPTPAMIRPAAAGPATAAKLPYRLSSAFAATSWSSSTILGSSDRIEGVPKLKTSVPRKSSRKSAQTRGWATEALTARATETSANPTSLISSSRRRSTASATAPPTIGATSNGTSVVR